MDFKIELEKRLAMYKEKVVNGRKPELVLFFSEVDGDPVDHVLIYEEQIPAINVFFEQTNPHFAVIKEMGDIKYIYSQ